MGSVLPMNKEKLRAYLSGEYDFKLRMIKECQNSRSKISLPYDQDLYSQASKEIYLYQGEANYINGLIHKLDAGEFE
jgi:hypothetical protein